MPNNNPPSPGDVLNAWADVQMSNTLHQMQFYAGSPTLGGTKPVNKKATPKSTDTPPAQLRKGFKVGADPELFIFKDGRPIPAECIPGDKQEPYIVPGGAIQRDGMAAEFNIDPVTTFEDFVKNFDLVIDALKSHLPKGCTLEAFPAVTFDPEVFDPAPDELKTLGCSPDYNAWTGQLNPPPNPENPYLRCAGGHLHIGWQDDGEFDDQHVLNCRDLTKQLDYYLGLWSLQNDPDTHRRKLYGKAGACRLKPYGVEYRVLSNFWVFDNNLRKKVWNRLCYAIDAISGAFLPEAYGPEYNKLVVDSIDNSLLSPSLYKLVPNVN